MQKFKVGEASAGSRADVYLATLFPDFTRTTLSQLFNKHLLINDSSVKAGYRLREGDVMKVDTSPLHHVPEELDLSVLYEDDDVLVIDKPEGVLSHSKGTLNTEGTVASFLGKYISDEEMGGNRAGIVHRLDRGTSGVILGAKNLEAQAWLQKQFSQRKVKKIYIAVVEGIPEPEAAVIDAPIERNPKQPSTFRVRAGGKSAQTKYQVIKTFEKKGKSFAELVLEPTTGRTHQLRVHLNYIGHPIVGDRTYGKEGDRMLLHAKSLELTLPSRKRMVFESVLPKSFEDFTGTNG